MSTLLYYLVQVVIASGILYLYYHVALRNKQFHQYNRFYLLGAVVISILVPFLNIPVYFTPQETQSSIVLETLTVISSPLEEAEAISPATIVQDDAAGSFFTPYHLIYYAYILIALLALARIAYSLFRISRLKRNNTVEKIDTIYFVNTNEPGTPFSFFRWIFWNRNIELQSPKGEQIFRHELFHIQQRHSIDLLFMELLSVIFWINPFFHLMKKELRAIHEFLADQFAMAPSNKWNYAELLLMQALQTKHSLVNPFFHNQIKRRIAMITNPEKTSHRYLRKLLVLPVAVLIVTLFAFKYKKAEEITPDVDPAVLPAGYTMTVNNNDTPRVKVTAGVSNAFPGGIISFNEFIEKNLDQRVPIQNNAPAGNYNVYLEYYVEQLGNIDKIKPLTKIGYGMEDEAIRVISLIDNWPGGPQSSYPIRMKVLFKFVVPDNTTAGKPLDEVIVQGRPTEVSAIREITVIGKPLKKDGYSPYLGISTLKKATIQQLMGLEDNTEIVNLKYTTDTEKGQVLSVNYVPKYSEQIFRDLFNDSKPGRMITLEDVIIRVDGKEKKLPSRFYYIMTDKEAAEKQKESNVVGNGI